MYVVCTFLVKTIPSQCRRTWILMSSYFKLKPLFPRSREARRVFDIHFIFGNSFGQFQEFPLPLSSLSSFRLWQYFPGAFKSHLGQVFKENFRWNGYFWKVLPSWCVDFRKGKLFSPQLFKQIHRLKSWNLISLDDVASNLKPKFQHFFCCTDYILLLIFIIIIIIITVSTARKKENVLMVV